MRLSIRIVGMQLLLGLSLPHTKAVAQVPVLGRGYTPHTDQIQQAVVPLPSDMTPVGGASNATQFGLVATSQAFERVLDADMSVSAGGTGWGASVRASLTKENRANRKQITFAAVQQVIRGSVALPANYRLSATASNALRTDPSKYLKSYGTSVIESVKLGGSAVFLFTFTFLSEEEAMRSSLNADGQYGAAKGSLRVNIRELLKRSTNNVTVSGFVTGTTMLPSFAGATVNGPRSSFFSAEFSEEMLQNIMTYLDGFAATVERTRIEDLSQVEFVPRHLSNVDGVNLSQTATALFQSAEAFGRGLEDKYRLLDERRIDLLRMTTLYRDFNTDLNLARAAMMIRDILTSEKELDALREQFNIYLTIDERKLAAVSVPDVPPTFCTAAPREVSPPVFRRLDAGNPRNRPSLPPRNWLEFVVTPRMSNVTYTVRAVSFLDHSRSDRGCNWGHTRLYARRRAARPNADAREVGVSWVRSLNPQLMPEEDLIDDTGEFRVCSGQAPATFTTKAFSFVANETHDVRILHANWDDVGYDHMTVQVYQCGQP